LFLVGNGAIVLWHACRVRVAPDLGVGTVS
jgi:hypothetical protein